MTELLVGDDIAGYQLLELAGEGGMGRVYRARQKRLDRIVALKVIRPEIAADPSFRERFQREARMAASIDHPCVVPVYEADEVDGVLFVAMRWIGGPNLRRMLQGEAPLEPARAAHIVGRVAAALEAAHAAGLVHRDVKPANILLEGSQVYLSDFGIARAVSGPDEATVTGGFVGTVDYASPELLRAEAIDSRVDIYALGCVLHEMLTGAVAYPADSLAEKVTAHLTVEPPRPSTIQPGVPGGFDRIIQKALAKDPAARYATAGDLAAATDQAVRGSRRLARSGSQLRRVQRRLVVGAATALLLAGIAAAAVLAIPAGSAPRQRQHPNLGATDYSASGSVDSMLLQLAQGTAAPGASRTGSVAAQCGNVFSGAPRACHSPWGGVVVIGNRGMLLHTRTMNVKLTGVSTTAKLRIQGGRFAAAPRGTRFVVLDITVSRTTKKYGTFEPNEATGRMTALVFRKGKGGLENTSGPLGQNYFELAAAPTLARYSMAGAELSLRNHPYSGQLTFDYPIAVLSDLSHGALIVRDLGETWGPRGSFTVIRLAK